jgi:uncharacterized protein (TIGR00106 family)
MVLLEFSIFPNDKGVSLSPYVARAIDIVDKSGLPYRLHSMGTVIEGEWDEAMGVVTRCFEELARDCERITVTIKVDYRQGKSGRLSSKIDSIEQAHGRSVKS